MIDTHNEVRYVFVKLVPTSHQCYYYNYKSVERYLKVYLLQRHIIKTTVAIGSLNRGSCAHNDSQRKSYYQEYQCPPNKLISYITLYHHEYCDAHEAKIYQCYQYVHIEKSPSLLLNFFGQFIRYVSFAVMVD